MAFEPEVLPSPCNPNKAEQRWYKSFDGWKELLEVLGILFAIGYAVITYLQWRDLRTNFDTDQRAWISVSVQNNVAVLPGDSIPISFELLNSGKTPAKNIEGDVVVTAVERGQHFIAGDFSHQHHKVHVGVIFPNAPLQFSLPVIRYGSDSPEPIVPDGVFRHDLETGQRTLVFYGKIQYNDALGTPHWTHFCIGINNNTPASFDIEHCVEYNAIDSNQH